MIILLMFGLPARPTEETSAEETCCEKAEGACNEPAKAPADDLMMENLSRQFIFVSPLN